MKAPRHRKVAAAKMAGIIKTTDYKKFVINGQEVPFSALDRCLPNDKVVGTSSKWSMVSRGPQPPLVGILDCVNKTRYGFTSKNVPIYLFHPMNKAYPPFRVGSTIDPTQNYLVIIQYETWELGQSMPRGSLVQTLGAVGDLEAESAALYWLYSPWTGYTKKTSAYIPPEIDVNDRVESALIMAGRHSMLTLMDAAILTIVSPIFGMSIINWSSVRLQLRMWLN